MARVTRSSEWLAANFGSVPLVVLAYMRNDPSGASIYPAVWNLMLAARGHGVGTTLTTILGTFQGAALAELLGVPTDRGWVNAAAVPCGYPTGRWGVASRRPAHEVVHHDRWGQPPAWTVPEPLWPKACPGRRDPSTTSSPGCPTPSSTSTCSGRRRSTPCSS